MPLAILWDAKAMSSRKPQRARNRSLSIRLTEPEYRAVEDRLALAPGLSKRQFVMQKLLETDPEDGANSALLMAVLQTLRNVRERYPDHDEIAGELEHIIERFGI